MSDEVWLVYRSEPYEAPDLLGVYASEASAEARADAEVRRLGGARWSEDYWRGVTARNGSTVRVDREPVLP